MRYDLIAGLSVAGLLLPEAVAYSSIAGLAPQHGLFAAVAGLLAYAALGRSRFAIVSPTSSSAAILAASAASVAFDTSQAAREALAFGAVLLAGAFFVIAGALRLGRLSSFVSRPVLRGFAFGLGLTIVARQIPTILALDGVSGNLFAVLVAVVRRFADWNMTSLAVGGAALAALLALRRLPFLPGAFIVLVAGVLLAFGVDLPSRGVKLVGAIDMVPTWPGLPDLSWREWTRLAEVAAPLFLIIYAESWGSMRSLALRHGDSLSADRELLALGAANLLSGLVRGMPVGAGFSASSANEGAGARTRLAGFVAALAMILLVANAGPYMARLPQPVLAAVVIAALAHALDPTPLLRLWRIDRDQYVALAAALGVMILGVVDGMLLAVALSIVAILQRMATPKVVVLGRLANTHDFVEATHPGVDIDPRIEILRPTQPLFFANADLVFSDIVARIRANSAAEAVILSLEETSSLDSTTLDGLIECDARLSALGRRLFLARVKQSVVGTLAAAGADELAQRAAQNFSVSDAWKAARATVGAPPG
ncbi:MAG TPA: SulP family inorganic anion transporter [Rhodoblastus sp.]|nr:SulP family inorganic anion transporter [Rhodoblastus sp.]